MNYPYDLLYLDVQAAKQGLTRSLQEGLSPLGDNPFPATANNVPVAKGQPRIAKRSAPSTEFTRSRRALNNPATPLKRSGLTGNDMSTFSFSLTLLLLGTIAAADTNHPVFWLLVGPAPLVAGFTILMFFRKRVSRRGLFIIFGNRDDY